MSDSEIQLYLTAVDATADAEHLDRLTTALLRDLQDLGALSVARSSSGSLPEGAKAGDPFTMGALVVVALPALLPKLVEFLQAWSLRGEGRRIKVKTPDGLEVEFTPEKKLSEDALLSLVDKLSRVTSSKTSDC